MIYINKKKVQIHATQMHELENIMLYEISHTEKTNVKFHF